MVDKEISNFNVPWFLVDDYDNLEIFGDIESVTIERYYQFFNKDKTKEDYRYVILGAYSIDLKFEKMKETKDLYEEDGKVDEWTVKRINTYMRPRSAHGKKYSKHFTKR